MATDAGSLTLVAMPRSGETFIVRDTSGILWLYPPEGGGEPVVVDEADIEQAFRYGDWDRIDATFESWQALESDRQRRAAVLAPGRDIGIADYDEVDVRRVIASAQASEPAAARRILHRLLREVAVVRRGGEAYDQITRLLIELDEVGPREDEPAELAAALMTVSETVARFRDLVKQDRARYAGQLAGVLEVQAALVDKDGDSAQAQAARDEAATVANSAVADG